MAIFEGSAVALITPFTEEKKIDFEQLEKLVEFHIEHQTDAIVVCGTTGESSTMTHEEHSECIRFVVKKVKNRIPVIAGTGSNDTMAAIELSLEAKRDGVDGLLLVTPYYNKATQNGLFLHFSEIAKAVNIPILLYNVPSRTSCNLEAKTCAKLFEQVKNIVGVKEASGNVVQSLEILHRTQGKMDVYSGNDDLILPILSIGGKGVISVLANIVPKQTHQMVAEYLSGNIIKSQHLQREYYPLIQALFCEVNPIPVKAACKLKGLCNGIVRMPLTEMEEDNQKRLEKVMKDCQLLS
ncbi:4-hydroxy-tetrahydrodipicolinate synthase [Clostridia bacterium]|nr:4-hydroxy-tetrahydrodipicolinate synthase [Clostridia bacterium]